jgi:hypothetical chaperone protein
VNYLAIDFGTTNTLAAVVSSERKLELLPLDGENVLLPSCIFVRSVHAGFPGILSEAEIDRRLRRKKDKEMLRREEAIRSIDTRLKSYSAANFPRVKKPDTLHVYDRAKIAKILTNYERDLKNLPDAIKYFEEVTLPAERKRLEANLPNPSANETLYQEVVREFIRDDAEARLEDLKEHSFFSALTDPNFEAHFGSEAIRYYYHDPLSGYFMRSPKAFLGASSARNYEVFLVSVISKIIKYVKGRAEAYTGQEFSGVVLGRPVNYIGSEYGGSNDYALGIMRQSAARAGFVNVRFVKEPLAASLVISSEMFDTRDPALVIDIGGGTTDVAYLQISPDRDNKLSVIGMSGERIGGSDFDEALGFRQVGPFVGKDLNLPRSGVVPAELILSALSIRDLRRQADFQNSADTISKFLDESPGSVEITRLYQLFKDRLQHRVILSAEEVKKSLSGVEAVNHCLDYFYDKPSLKVTTSDFVSSTLRCTGSVINIVRSIFHEKENLLPPTRVFFAGGMSYCDVLVGAVREQFSPGSTFSRMRELHTIVAGLAVVARQLSLSDSVSTEPKYVRGIEVEE